MERAVNLYFDHHLTCGELLDRLTETKSFNLDPDRLWYDRFVELSLHEKDWPEWSHLCQNSLPRWATYIPEPFCSLRKATRCCVGSFIQFSPCSQHFGSADACDLTEELCNRK